MWNIFSTSNFHKQKFLKDGLQPQCKKCWENFVLKHSDKIKTYNEQNRGNKLFYEKKRRETNLSFKLEDVKHSKHTWSGKEKTFDLIGCYRSFFKSLTSYHLYGDMTVETYGSVWSFDQCLPIFLFHLLDENERRKYSNWVKLGTDDFLWKIFF